MTRTDLTRLIVDNWYLLDRNGAFDKKAPEGWVFEIKTYAGADEIDRGRLDLLYGNRTVLAINAMLDVDGPDGATGELRIPPAFAPREDRLLAFLEGTIREVVAEQTRYLEEEAHISTTTSVLEAIDTLPRFE